MHKEEKEYLTIQISLTKRKIKLLNSKRRFKIWNKNYENPQQEKIS